LLGGFLWLKFKRESCLLLIAYNQYNNKNEPTGTNYKNKDCQ
jgi:hypothetical protein